MRTLALLALLALALLSLPAASADDGSDPVCVPTNGGGMDYHSEACVDADRGGCRVWHESYNEYDGHRYVCYVRA